VFEELKERFITEPVLVMPDLDKEMRIEAECIRFCYRRSIVNEV